MIMPAPEGRGPTPWLGVERPAPRGGREVCGLDRFERLLAPHPRLRPARPGRPGPDGRCVLHWMQRAQRGVDNGALNLAIAVGNTLGLPVLSAFALTADYPG